MARRIPLTKGFVALVDDDDYERVAALKWHAHVNRNGKAYAARFGPRPQRHRIFLHRFILGLGPRGNDGAEVDHINRDTLDDRKSNLRCVTHRENALNSDRARVARPCAQCGAEFIPYMQSRRFCSQPCAQQHRKLSPIRCQNCGREFKPAGRRAKNCSSACGVASSGKKQTILLSAFGESKTLAEWADDPRCVVSKTTLWARVRRNGKWSAEAALATPIRWSTRTGGTYDT